MSQVIKSITTLVCLFFLGIGLFSILKNWNETDSLYWPGVVFLVISGGFYGVSYAVRQNLLLEHVLDEQNDEIQDGEL